MAVTGSSEKVKGSARATAMVAVNPGIAPTTTPISTPMPIAMKLSTLRNRLRTSEKCSMRSLAKGADQSQSVPEGSGTLSTWMNSRLTSHGRAMASTYSQGLRTGCAMNRSRVPRMPATMAPSGSNSSQ